MRRRRDDGGVEPPAELLVFDGMRDGFVTPAAWDAAFHEWRAARRRWASAHGVPEADMPGEVGDAPWDPSLI